MRNRLFAPNAPAVVAEVIDGEVVIMNLTTGNYYSSDGTGAVIWGWIEDGKTLCDIERLLGQHYEASAEAITAALTSFLDRLLDEGLVRESTEIPTSGGGHGLSENESPSRQRLVPPELHVYTDMQDLLLLDPIHDVDEAGWPRPKADTAGDPA